MNIKKMNETIKAIVLFLLSNIATMLLLVGLSVIVYTFFRISTNAGFFSLGIVLVAIALLTEHGRR